MGGSQAGRGAEVGFGGGRRGVNALSQRCVHLDAREQWEKMSLSLKGLGLDELPSTAGPGRDLRAACHVNFLLENPSLVLCGHRAGRLAR